MQDVDRAIIEAGYQPKLWRTLGYFSSFAVSFSFLSITTGIFANYGYVLTKAGPFGYWTWLIVAAGHMLVALVYAEMAGRMPLAGCAYNWNTKLSGPLVGWFTGWLTVTTYSIAIAAVTATAVPVIGSIINVQFGPMATRFITASMILLQSLINIYGIRFTSKINTIAVCAELVSIVVMGALVLIATFHHGEPNFGLLTTIPDQPRPYLPGFLMACLIGAWTLVGFETSADMSEETVDSHNIAPKGVLSSMLASVLLGFAFIVIMTIAIPNVDTIKSAANPLIAIISYQLGDTVTKIFMGFVVVAIFACSLINITSASRILYAIARDGQFIAPDFYQKISAHRVPINTICFVTILGIAFAMEADSITALYAASAIIPALIYLITVISFAFGMKKLGKTNTFSLGRWHLPVVVIAIIWLIIEIGILTMPKEFHTGAFAVIGVILAGAMVRLMIRRNNPRIRIS